MKSLFKIFFFIASVTVANYNYIQSNKEVALIDLTLANVEALASDELSPDFGNWYVYMDWIGGMDGFIQRNCASGGSSVC